MIDINEKIKEINLIFNMENLKTYNQLFESNSKFKKGDIITRPGDSSIFLIVRDNYSDYDVLKLGEIMYGMLLLSNRKIEKNYPIRNFERKINNREMRLLVEQFENNKDNIKKIENITGINIQEHTKYNEYLLKKI